MKILLTQSASALEFRERNSNLEVAMRIKEQKYILPDGREITIKSAGPEDALKVKHHREATSAETHFMAREPEDGQFNLEKITEILGSVA